MELDIEVMENPIQSIGELGQRIKNGTAFIVGSTGMSRKRRKELEKIARAALKHKKDPVKFHVVQIGRVTFEVLE